MAAAVAAITLVGACSSASHPAAPKTTSETTSGPRKTTFPAGTSPANVSAAVNLFDAFFDTEPGARWYAGGGFASLIGDNAGLVVFVFAGTAAVARPYCTPLTRAASYFLQGHPYSMELQGRVLVPSGIVTPAKFAPIHCDKYAGPLLDPVPPTVPNTLAAAAQRFAKLLDRYIGTFGHGADSAWVFSTDASGGVVTVTVKDRTPALGAVRCATLRALAKWFLGRFATRATLRVAGGGNVSWPAENCP